MDLRDRIVELKRVDTAELLDNEGNWRIHPKAQRGAMRGLVTEVGIADALLAYHSERNDGALTLIDGHQRKRDYPGTWPVLVLDVEDAEADKLLAFFDPIAGMAEAADQVLRELLSRIETDDPYLKELRDRQQAEADLAALMNQVAQDFGDLSGEDQSDDRSAGLDSARAKIRLVVWLEDLPTFEKAIRAVGNPNRGESLIAICQFYPEHHGHTEGQ